MSSMICNTDEKTRLNSSSRLLAKISLNHGLPTRLSSTGKLSSKEGIYRNLKLSLSGTSKIIANENVNFSPKQDFSDSGSGKIRGYTTANLGVNSRVSSSGSFKNYKTDKFAGYKPSFRAYEKLYPTQDISFKSKFTNTNINIYKVENNIPSPTSIYTSIDEGVFTGDYVQDGKIGSIISDDSKSFALTFRIFASGDIQYKFRVAKPISVAKLSYLAIRASAPFDNYIQKKPQQYKIYDIKFEDPSGNLIIQYEDMLIRGDTYYTTYLSKPLVNNLLLPTWDSKYPLMDASGSYSITLNMSYDCNTYPFTSNFNSGYEQTCIINSTNLNPNPFISLNISSLEIGNSGGVGILNDNYLPFFSQVPEKSKRERRVLLPTQLFINSFNNGIYPQASSVWQATTDDIDYNNLTANGSSHLLNKIRNDNYAEYISLIDSSPVQSSGRLILKFNSKPDREAYDNYIDGAFRFGGSSDFSDAKLVNYLSNDNFFDVDTLELKIIAKKVSGGQDYPIDVVGYSDDKLLNVTPAIGGFLQNSGAFDFNSSEMPDTSGFYSNTFSISDSSLSDQSQYFSRDIGDHYYLNNSPLVNSTSFQEYTIPLNIYQNPYELGFTRYSLSSFFENLYLDISPIPSGASICNIKLVVNYKPANALMMHTLGSPELKSIGRKQFTLLPSSSGTINSNVHISGFLMGFGSPSGLTSNYSRRWRGIEGNILSGGDFDQSRFDFSFNHVQANNPFLTSYIDFHNIDDVDIYDTDNNYVGQAGSNFDILDNLGWRYSSEQLFNDISTDYKSISWRDSIFDKFDRAIRISSDNILEINALNNDSFDDYNNPENPIGFALFLRFTPDKVVDNDLNNCLIFAYENSTKYALALICESGFLKLKVRKSDDTVITISDTVSILSYQFPLSIIITYNDDGTYKYKLYTDNKTVSNFNNLRASSSSYISTYVLSNSPAMHIGFSQVYNAQSPLPMFIHEIGLSNGVCNIVESNPNQFNKEITATNVFNSYEIPSSYIDDDISLWKLGDFKVCQFSPDFDFLTKRNGKDFLTFTLKHNGSGYSQITDLSLPNNINLSGVAYHTQIENDFLRFNLSNIPSVDKDRFHAVAPRICKTLPRGYQFNENAICVDTILEHNTNNNIIWNDGKIGPKLIVSLYAPTQDYAERPSKSFGLVSRSTHHLEPSGCIRKLTTKFTFDDLLDISEPWASFDKESYTKEFKEKYFSHDIDSMFLQYDLVYPSGSPFSSLIKIHSANVRLDDALVISDTQSGILNLYASGQKYQTGHLNLFVPENGPIIYSGITLFIDSIGPIGSGLNMFVDSSGFPRNAALNLYGVTIGSVSSSSEVYGDLFGSSPVLGLGLSVSGQLMRETGIPLYVEGSGYYAQSYISMSTIVNDDIYKSNNLNLSIRGISNSQNFFPSSIAPLFVYGQEYPTSVSNYGYLFVSCDNPAIVPVSGGMNLHTLNYPISESLASSSSTVRWTYDNLGTNITVEDNSYAYVDSDDNIRGVDLLCYGSCVNTNRCSETIVNIHGVNWYDPEVCVDGGIFRAKNTYTNLSYPSGSFRHVDSSGNITYDPLPYSGHFYGIRKYIGLAPNLPYLVNITGKAGSTDSIDIPTEIIEVEYNKLEDDETSVDHSGFRIVPSGSYNYASGEFAKSVASKEDLLIVGSPMKSIVYNSGIGPDVTLEKAGTIFIYKRNPRPSGYEWPLENYKSSWQLQEVLHLPSGLLKDYYTQQTINIGLPFSPIQTTWFVGQEGRQLGHSLDISINKNENSLGENSRQIIVAGGPGAKWTPREFDNDPPSGVAIGLMVFTDEFIPRIPAPLPGAPFRTIGYEDVLNAIKDKDLLFNYFGNPRIKFDTKLIICQPIGNSTDRVAPEFPDKPSFMTLKTIARNYGYPADEARTSGILEGMKSAFFEAFQASIPPILGIYIDNSNSLGRESLEPAIDQFIDFYKSYTFENGLVDSRGVRESGQVIEYVPDDYVSENWVEMSKLILSEVLDTGNLMANNQVRFLTNTVGDFNSNLAGFNIPPESGGKVYIFEKESGSWNLIQEIKSPNITYEHPDRFGHAVSISDDGEVIAVGSPYINQAVTVYERKEEEKDRFYSSIYSWVVDNRSQKYPQQILAYQRSNDPYALYLALDKDDKFKSRIDLNIQEYQNIYTFDYSNMQPVGSWSFIPSVTAPTSRLGYSVDVNEDGSVVVAGAPTDSMNFYNDADIYYSCNCTYRGTYYSAGYSDPYGVIPNNVKSAWSSSVNAGSIHVFESRKYYPHNKVIEYGRFGNLHEITSNDTLDSGHFHYLSDIFSDKNFTKTEFTDSKIPKEAGLVFIITPAIDALTISDEVFNNISNWLALGDRNLVLIANDPIWEGNGKYKNSNDILNKLLERLQSRMRIVPARSKYESLPEGYSSFSNVVPSFVPQGSTNTYVTRSAVRGSGVADIKVYYPGYYQQMPCEEVTDCSPDPQKIQIQSRCEMPLMHYGDLRAQWNALCCTNGGSLIYGYNWPFIFGSYTPACGDVEFEEKPSKNFEPIPLLAAAEQVDQEIVYPPVPAQYRNYPKYRTVYENTIYYDFGSPVSENADFVWDADNEPSGVTFNITNNISKELFYKPEENGILQARGISKIDVKPYISKEVVSDKTHFAIEQGYEKTTSKIIVLAGVTTESEVSLFKSGFNDQNVKLYVNLVSQSSTQKGRSNIAQIGGWTGRTSFKDGYADSILKTVFTDNNNNVTENVQTASLNSNFNVGWIANIASQPSTDDLIRLKEWLSYGDKKLVITCDNDINSVKHAQELCSKLNIDIEPVYLPYLDKYQQSNVGYLEINQSNQVGGQLFLPFKKTNTIEEFVAAVSFYPLKLNSKATSIVSNNENIYDEVPKENINTYWDMNAGIVRLNVPVQDGSGYKVFITTAADTLSEIVPLDIYIDNASEYPSLPSPQISTSYIQELDANGEQFGSKLINTSVNLNRAEGTATKTINVQSSSGVDSINIYVSSAAQRLVSGVGFVPKTVKLIGISGVMIPVYEKVSSIEQQIPTGEFETVKIADEQPEIRETVQIIRPISTDNTKYCTSDCTFLGGQLIDDGPIVAAQEIEILSSFDAGVARSRITVITDSSIVQGRYVADNGVIPSDTYSFIRSLYPETTFPSTTYGRQFNVYNKILSPERGSPSKYLAYASLSGLNMNFGGSGSASFSQLNQYESQYIFKNVSRPKVPWKDETDENVINDIKNQFISGFLNSQVQHGSTARFSGVIAGTLYSDAGVAGGLPQLFKDKGYDYLDFDKFPSGYPGDLFGYSLCVKGNKIIVGSPFSAFGTETVTPWTSGTKLHLGYDGGAGSVYMFEKSGDLSWVCARKFRPQSLMGQLSGINSYSDHFGQSVAIQNDTIIVGAPNHDYGNHYDIFYQDGAFARKNFDSQFDIPERNIYDLGLSGVRDNLEVDGLYSNNAGAIYVYENKITDWENKRQSWQLVEKVISDSPNPSGEKFGKQIYLSRPYRSDADYTIFAGCNLASGDGTLNIGAVYSKDIMLKKQPPSLASSGAWIDAKVFGERAANNQPSIGLKFSNSGDKTTYYSSGIIIANSDGEIFLEVSGQDPSTRGFISHRPYIESVIGYYQYGKILENGMILFCGGQYTPPSSELNLFMDAEKSSYVYNNLGLYSSAVIGVVSGVPSGLYLYNHTESGVSIHSSGLTLATSGTWNSTDTLSLRVRGK